MPHLPACLACLMLVLKLEGSVTRGKCHIYHSAGHRGGQRQAAAKHLEAGVWQQGGDRGEGGRGLLDG